MGSIPTLTASSYTLSGVGGREIGAFSFNFNFARVRIIGPAKGQIVNPSQPLTITWSGGEYVRDYFVVNAAVVDTAGTMVTAVSCTIAGGRSSSFTMPSWVWSQVPQYSGGSGFVSAGGGSYFDQVTTSVPGLDYGLGLNLFTWHSVQVALTRWL